MQEHQRLQAVESDRESPKGQAIMELRDTRYALGIEYRSNESRIVVYR